MTKRNAISKATDVQDKNASVDLSTPEGRKTLAAKIKRDIDAYCVSAYGNGHRTHLGASLIGRECSRFLWYTFRWVQAAKFDGRKLRIFDRGHREEPRFIEWLEGIGASVSWFDEAAPFRLILRPDTNEYEYIPLSKVTAEHAAFDVDNNKDHHAAAEAAGVFPEYPQHRISGCGGHFGGSLDALLTLPEGYCGVTELVLINEYKTQGTARFSKMTTSGVQIEKPEHFAQMSVYGKKKNVKYGCYMAINKNDDDIHVEIVELDWQLAERLELKAYNIIFSRTPPPKLSESIAHTTCTYCDMKTVCHQNVPYEKNCRSCTHAQAIDNAEWGCNHWRAVIPADAIAAGCPNWTPAV